MQNAYALSYPDESFDLVVGSSILHHLDIGEALRRVYRVLRPGRDVLHRAQHVEPADCGAKERAVH